MVKFTELKFSKYIFKCISKPRGQKTKIFVNKVREIDFFLYQVREIAKISSNFNF